MDEVMDEMMSEVTDMMVGVSEVADKAIGEVTDMNEITETHEATCDMGLIETGTSGDALEDTSEKNASTDAWDELAEACLLVEDEEEIEELLEELSDEELMAFIVKYPGVFEEYDNAIDDNDGANSDCNKNNSNSNSNDSDEHPIDGYIYLITNLVNGKRYVGQTTKSIEERWRQHVSASRHLKKHTLVVDRAIRKYGVDNFTCEIIEFLHGVQKAIIDQREAYWIERHKTYIPEYGKDAGYNLTRGGHGIGTRFTLNEEQEIIGEYCSMNKSNIEIARKHKMSPASVRVILEKYQIPLRTAEEQAELSRQRFSEVIEQYDDENKLLRTFLGAYEVAHWIIDNVEDMEKGSVRSIAACIRIAMYRHEYKYGYYWNAPNLSEAECQKRLDILSEKKGQYYLAHKERVYDTDQYSTNFCPICGKRILPESEYCQQHAREIRSKKIREMKQSGIITPMLGGIPLTRAELEDLISHYSVVEIGRQYGVSDNAVRKFARRNYGIDNIGELQRFRLWNEEQACYEYMPEFPMTWQEVCANLEEYQTVAVLAKHYKIRSSTLKKYLKDTFGEMSVHAELSKIHHHIAVYDKTIDMYFPNTYACTRYLLTFMKQVTSVAEAELDCISRRIQKGLSKQGSYSIYNHDLYKVESQEYYESDRKYMCNE